MYEKWPNRNASQIDDQIHDLTAMRNVLDSLVKGCQTDPSTEYCSLINTLSKEPAANSDSSEE